MKRTNAKSRKRQRRKKCKRASSLFIITTDRSPKIKKNKEEMETTHKKMKMKKSSNMRQQKKKSKLFRGVKPQKEEKSKSLRRVKSQEEEKSKRLRKVNAKWIEKYATKIAATISHPSIRVYFQNSSSSTSINTVTSPMTLHFPSNQQTDKKISTGNIGLTDNARQYRISVVALFTDSYKP